MGPRRRFGAGAAIAILALAWTTPAWAHVAVDGVGATRGAEQAKLSFRVANESPTAVTNKLEVYFPDEHPFAFVSVRHRPEWKHLIDRRKLATPIAEEGGGSITEAVSKVTWQGGQIGADEFEEFTVAVGPLPDADRLVFKVVQSYSDGKVVRWVEENSSGAEEPEHPAAVLELAAGDGSTTPEETTGSTEQAQTSEPKSEGDAGTGDPAPAAEPSPDEESDSEPAAAGASEPAPARQPGFMSLLFLVLLGGTGLLGWVALRRAHP